MKRFCNKVSIITGSTNGIGRATAIMFARQGSKLTITGRDREAAAITRQECLKAGLKSGDILEILGDITEESVQNLLVKETVNKFGKLDILVNNHGGALKEKNNEGNLEYKYFDAVMNLNCKSTLGMCLKALPYLKKTHGAVVNVSSVASTTAAIPIPYYAMAKASLDHLTRILAYRHAEDGIRVNCVNPGLILTSALHKVGVSKEQREKIFEKFLKHGIPLGRIGMPEEIAELIAFLADNRAASYITGQAILIDGGSSLSHIVGSADWTKKPAPMKA